MLKELECVKAVLKLAAEFVSKPDFSLSRAFFAVSKGKKDIGNIVLGRFLEQALGKTFPQEMLYSIIERLDLDSDGRISQKDMSIFLQRVTNILSESDHKPSSPLKMVKIREPESWKVPLSEPVTAPTPLSTPQLAFFSRIISLQKDLEITRQRLAVENEIGLHSVFRCFDQSGSGQLTVSDFEAGFETLGVKFDYGALCLLIRHYDSDRDGSVSEADFCRMLLTTAPEYNELYCLEGRRARGLQSASEKAAATLISTFDALLAFEKGLEEARASFVSQLDYREFFKEVDIDRSDSLTLNDVKQFMGNGGVFPSLFEVISLIELLDINRDGKVDYSEFVDVLTPKSPEAISLP